MLWKGAMLSFLYGVESYAFQSHLESMGHLVSTLILENDGNLTLCQHLSLASENSLKGRGGIVAVHGVCDWYSIQHDQLAHEILQFWKLTSAQH